MFKALRRRRSWFAQLRTLIKNRLREVECPVDMIEQIGVWSRESVGEGYFLEKLYACTTRL